jgi:ribosomal protein L21E
MGMRFDKVKTDDWVRLGSALGNAYVDHNAGNAYKEGTKVNTRTDSNYGAMDPNAVYSGEGADGAMTNAEAASYGLNVPKQDPVAGRGVTRQ